MTDALLREILVELRGLRRDLSGTSRATKRLDSADLGRLASLLPVIAEAIGDREFTTAELMAFAEDFPEAEALREELQRSCDGDPRCVGRLLARAVNVHVDGRQLLRVGTDHNAALWQIRTAGS